MFSYLFFYVYVPQCINFCIHIRIDSQVLKYYCFIYNFIYKSIYCIGYISSYFNNLIIRNYLKKLIVTFPSRIKSANSFIPTTAIQNPPIYFPFPLVFLDHCYSSMSNIMKQYLLFFHHLVSSDHNPTIPV